MNIVYTSQIRERGNRRDHQAGDMAELMVLNIPSVSGGANAWGWTRGIGVKNADVAGLRDTTQSFSDGKLEVVGYTSLLPGLSLATFLRTPSSCTF